MLLESHGICGVGNIPALICNQGAAELKSIALIFALFWGPGAVAAAGGADELAHINAALKAWIQAIEADSPYLLVDRGAAKLRLMHGKAVMRDVGLIADSLGGRPPIRHVMQDRLRRYRPSDPWVSLAPSAFDWEQNLVVDAPPTGALLFSDGLLLYADAIWHRVDALALQLQADDLRALYNACEPGISLVVLPVGWQEGLAP